MSGTESTRLAELSGAVRESSLKRLQAVPEGSENYRAASSAMSFADIAQHLIDADHWLFKKLKVETLTPMTGKAHSVEITARSQFDDLIAELKSTGVRRAELLESLSAEALCETVYDERYGGEVSVWWEITRGNLDHEAHHRGQIAACLRMIAPPE